jgi:hypothetical protein
VVFFRARGVAGTVLLAGAGVLLLLGSVSARAQSAGGYIEGVVMAEPSYGEVGVGTVAAFDPSGTQIAETTVTGGNYRIGPLPSGDYYLRFVDPTGDYPAEWWQDATDLAAADPVSVGTAETTTNVVFVVGPTGAIADGWIGGRLTLDGGGDVPVGYRLSITAYDAGGEPVASGEAWTGPAGAYRIALPAGTFRLRLLDSSEFRYEGVGCPCTDMDGQPGMHIAWWPDQPSFATADEVMVSAGQVTVIDWPLRLWQLPIPAGNGFIEGRLTVHPGAAQMPADFIVFIDAYDAAGELLGTGQTTTDLDGRYRIDLPPGTHRLLFRDGRAHLGWGIPPFYEGIACPCTGVDGSPIEWSVWWPDKSGFTEAAPVVVNGGETTYGIDFTLREWVDPGHPPDWGAIEGRLFFAATGEPLPADLRFAVTPYDSSGERLRLEVAATALTDADGRYQIELPAGTYRLRFHESNAFAYEGVGCPCTHIDGSPAMYSAWWPDRSDFASADWVEIRAGETTTGIDWPLRYYEEPPRPGGGFIEGRLFLAATGESLPENTRFSVRAYDGSGAEVGADTAWIDADGHYWMELPPGECRLMFYETEAFLYEGIGCPCTDIDGSEGIYTSWWPTASDFAGAELVEIVTGETLQIDWALRFRQQPAQPAVDGGELPFGGLQVRQVAHVAVLLIGLGGVLLAVAGRRHIAPPA